MTAWQMISFYTARTGYADEVKKLIRSAETLRVPLKVYEYEPVGSWRGNLNHKSECILKAFEEFPEKDIVFVDADAIIRRWPELFDKLSEKKDFDLSACFFRYSPRSGDADELLSGTLWIQNNAMGRRIVNLWHQIGLKRPNTRHQMCLKIAIDELTRTGEGPRIFRHSFAYTCIYDYVAARRNITPVIEHYQASRRLRKTVGYGISLLPTQSDIRSRIARERRAKSSQSKNINIMPLMARRRKGAK